MKGKIAYVTDAHLDETFPREQGVDARKNWKRILNDISEKGIRTIVYGGDIGEKTANKWFFESLKEYAISITLGNHDDIDEVIKHFDFERFGNQSRSYYVQEDDFYKSIFLDSSSGFIDEDQFNWLEKEVLTTKNLILFIHHPILQIDAEVDKQFALIGRESIKNLLLELENKVTIFSGHYHFQDHRVEKNIQQFITPAGSFQVEKIPNEIKIDATTFGYRIIELKKGGIDTEIITFSP